MFVLDTNVVSELRKAGSGTADTRVLGWAQQADPATLYISAVTVMELELGVLQMERRDARLGRLLRAWLEERVLPEFQERVLTIDAFVARRCASLHMPDPRAERDVLIAATAFVHAMTVVTRNTADFAATGVTLLNPWLPPPA
jgi:toxin FitB